MSAERPPTIAEPLRGRLERVGRSIAAGKAPTGLGECIEALGALPATSVSRLEGEIASLLHLHIWYDSRRVVSGGFWSVWRRPQRDDFALLARAPRLAPLFLFHRNGHLRQAALERLQEGLPSAFWVAALAWRLNDWVPQVRVAAAAAAPRVLGATDAAVMAAAASVLLGRRETWRRWGPERAILEDAFAREDVIERLASDLGSPAGRGAVLRDALRRPGMDRCLQGLAEAAAVPTVRAEAMRALIEGRARWPIGYERKWIDKSHGLWRRAVAYAERPIARPVPLETLVGTAARDRSVLVRRVAADGAVRHVSELGNLAEVAALLRHDRSPGIRERIAFLDRSLGRGRAGGSD